MGKLSQIGMLAQPFTEPSPIGSGPAADQHPLLQALFLRRLRINKPEGSVLGIDTMVMDNDEADKRHGVQPTYKKVKGFQPLQMTWGRYVLDAVFRGGNKHSNHGDRVAQMVRHMVHNIRKPAKTTI